MSFLILYITMGAITGIGLGALLIYTSKGSHDIGDDPAMTAMISLAAGAFWPLALVFGGVTLVFKGIINYKESREEKKKLAKKERERLQLEENRGKFFAQFQNEYNLLMFDRKVYETEGWNKENYEEFSNKVDKLANKIYSQAPRELKLYGSDVKKYTDQFKPILY